MGRNKGPFKLTAFVNSDYAGDLETAKSTTGYVVFAAGGPVAWRSKRQSSVARGVAHAEYFAGADLAEELSFIRNLLEELGEVVPPIVVKMDNDAARSWATKPMEVTAKARSIRVNYHFFRDEVTSGRLSVHRIDTGENPADGFTKPLVGAAYKAFVGRLGMVEAKPTIVARAT